MAESMSLTGGTQIQRPYASMRRQFTGLLILASVLPLLATAGGAWFSFQSIIFKDARLALEEKNRAEAQVVSLFVQERLSALDALASLIPEDPKLGSDALIPMLDRINKAFANDFIDIGIIDSEGNHIAYLGPYDLSDRNYFNETWFAAVRDKGRYISDVFVGHRNLPHLVLAVRRDFPNNKFRILRLTLQPAVLDKLIADCELGETGECFLLDASGRFQSTPRFDGSIYQQSGIVPSLPHNGARTRIVRDPEKGKALMITRWLLDDRWVLVTRQSWAEIATPVYYATAQAMASFALGLLLIVGVSYWTTRRLVEIVRNSDMEIRNLNSHLFEAEKLATLGELAAGLAHEINTPLATIQLEREAILRSEFSPAKDPEVARSLASISSQIERCKSVTGQLIAFSKNRASSITKIDTGKQLAQAVGLMRAQAKSKGIHLCLETTPQLPALRVDPMEFGQIAGNLVANALWATPRGGAIVVSAWSEGNPAWNEAETFYLTVEDTGSGIAPEIRTKIFQPFFTTRPADAGTGLGLSVCYGIVSHWGGSIAIDSQPDMGTAVHVNFPVTVGEFEDEGGDS